MQVDSVTNFRQNLSFVMQTKGVSQYTLADKSGITRVHINRVLTGKTPNLSIPLAETLAAALGLDVATMLMAPRDFHRVYSGGMSLKKLAATA